MRAGRVSCNSLQLRSSLCLVLWAARSRGSFGDGRDLWVMGTLLVAPPRVLPLRLLGFVWGLMQEKNPNL